MYKKIDLGRIVQWCFYFIILGIFCYGMKNTPIKPTLFLQIPGVFFVLISLFTKSYRLKINLSNMSFMLFTVLMISSVLMYKAEDSILYIYYFILALFTGNVITYLSKKQKVRILRLILILCMINAVVTITSLFFPDMYFQFISFFHTDIYIEYINSFFKVGNYSGIFIQVGQSAFYSSLGIILCVIFALLTNSKRNKWIYYLCALILIITLFLTSKRGLVLYTLIVLVVVLLSEFAVKNKKKFFKITNLIFLIVAFSFVFLIINKENLNIINRILNDDVLNGRDELYSASITLFRNNPILGNGIRSFRELNGFTQLDVHNNFLQLLAETGILGIILFYAGFIMSIIITKKNISIYRKKQISILLPVVSFAIQILIFLNSMTENVFFNIDTLFVYFIFCGISSYFIVGGDDIIENK